MVETRVNKTLFIKQTKAKNYIFLGKQNSSKSNDLMPFSCYSQTLFPYIRPLTISIYLKFKKLT